MNRRGKLPTGLRNRCKSCSNPLCSFWFRPVYCNEPPELFEIGLGLHKNSDIVALTGVILYAYVVWNVLPVFPLEDDDDETEHRFLLIHITGVVFRFHVEVMRGFCGLLISPWDLLRGMLLLFPSCSLDEDIAYRDSFCRVAFLCVAHYIFIEKQMDSCNL